MHTDPLDRAVEDLEARRRTWARLPAPEKIALLEGVRDRADAAAERWVQAAAEAGADVILATEEIRTGGRLLSESETVGNETGPAWAEAMTAKLAARPNVRLMTRTTDVGNPWLDAGIVSFSTPCSGKLGSLESRAISSLPITSAPRAP